MVEGFLDLGSKTYDDEFCLLRVEPLRQRRLDGSH